MDNIGRFVTIGLTPAWDMHCKIDGIEWGDHKTVTSYTKVPAGKSLNINKAMAYLRHKSIAAGLWGEDDIHRASRQLQPYEKFIDIKWTAVPGSVRTNITLEDTNNSRHLHLRFPDEICSEPHLKKLIAQLDGLVREKDICILAGSLPSSGLWNGVMEMITVCSAKKAKIVLDTSGAGFRQIVDTGGVWLISPNIDELAELAGGSVDDSTDEIIDASRSLLNRVEILLVSRGKRGAMVITERASYTCTLTGPLRPAICEVACGDHLLAGFLAGLREHPHSVGDALEKGVKLATAHAWGLTRTQTKEEIENMVQTTVCAV